MAKDPDEKKKLEAEDNESDEGQETATAPTPRGRGQSSTRIVKQPRSLDTSKYPKELDITKFHDKKSRMTKAKLEEAPRTLFVIHLAEKEDPKSYETVSINGYVMAIPKGKMVSVPEPVAVILAEQYNIEMTAGQEMLADRNETKDGVSASDALN